MAVICTAEEGQKGHGGPALVAAVPTPTFHPAEVRQSVHSGRCANDHPAAGTRTGTSQRGGYLAAVNGGRAHTSFTSLHERALRQLWNRDECRRDQKVHRHHAYVEGIDSVA